MGIHIDEECPVCKGQSKACDDEDWDCLNCSDKADQKHNAQMLDGCETDDERDAEMRHQTQGR